MFQRSQIILILCVLATGSYFLLSRISDNSADDRQGKNHIPDYYMENFSSTTMDLEGKPKNTLSADYMAHFPDDDTTELTKPVLEIYKVDKPPMVIRSERGLVSDNNEVVLLMGKVDLWQDNYEGQRELEVNTTEVRVLLKEDYAETSEHATIKGIRTIINSVGVKAYFATDRIELMSQVHGKIEPKKTL